MSRTRSASLRVEELESRENPVLIGLAPGFPAPLATSGPFDGVVTLFPPLFGTGQFNANPASVGAVVPFPGFNGTVRTAFADVNGDAIQDLIAITGPGTPLRVAVISGQNFTSYLIPPFDPFGDNFTGGGFVAAGNIDLIGGAEIVVTPDRAAARGCRSSRWRASRRSSGRISSASRTRTSAAGRGRRSATSTPMPSPMWQLPPGRGEARESRSTTGARSSWP